MVEQLRRDLGRFAVTRTGEETVRAFVPPPLPPHPPVDLRGFQQLLDRANQAVGRLDGLTHLLPDPLLLLQFYIQKEAVLSSQIEGTQSSLSDLLLHESAGQEIVPLDDAREVLNYVKAVYHGLDRLKEGFPLGGRLIREMHAILLAEGRGGEKQPGEFRTSQNWIGGTRPGNAFYVPPPPDEVGNCMADLERFIHDEQCDLPLLVKAAMAHVQFESIHPFLDGNGRLGRLLITLMMNAEHVLSEPMLYLSLYLKQQRSTYYDLLTRVRREGDWEAWIDFFLRGVREVAEQASATALRLNRLHQADRHKVELLGRPAASALLVYGYLQRRGVLLIPRAAAELRISAPTVAKSVEHLLGLGIVKELTGKRRDRIFVYAEQVDLLNEGTEIERGGGKVFGRAGEI